MISSSLMLPVGFSSPLDGWVGVVVLFYELFGFFDGVVFVDVAHLFVRWSILEGGITDMVNKS